MIPSSSYFQSTICILEEASKPERPETEFRAESTSFVPGFPKEIWTSASAGDDAGLHSTAFDEEVWCPNPP